MSGSALKVVFAGDTSVDETLEEAERANPGQPIKLRVQPQIQVKGIGYLAWRKLSWAFAVADVVEAQAFREALTLFFRVLTLRGIAQTCTGLRALLDTDGVQQAE